MYRVIQRIMDIVVSVIALIVLSPLFLIISCAIKIDSKGPVLYKQERLGKNGNIFIMFKFRTMVMNAENMGAGLFNYENDPRVTKVGNFLRYHSIDEWPQLFNIIKGEMSIVGPRPPVKFELGNYNNLNEEYKSRFSMMPGVTGWAQINGRNELSWNLKVKYDNQYIEMFKKYGILIDLKIMLITAKILLLSKGIYEVKDESSIDLSDEEIAIRETERVLSMTHSRSEEIFSRAGEKL